MNHLLLLLVASAAFLGSLHLSTGYSSGAPDRICLTMLPAGHQVDPQTSNSPYSLRAQQRSVTGGQQIPVTLEAPQNRPYKGFLLEARNVAQEDDILGTFSIDNNFPGKYLHCMQKRNSALTHKDAANKSTISVMWTAPNDFEGQVVFLSTFVQDYSTFWIKQRSENVEVRRGASVGSTQEGSFAVDDPFYNGCNTEKSCFGSPAGCVDNRDCEMVVTYQKLPSDNFKFEMKGKSSGYIASALSFDAYMNDDSVMQCVADGERVNIATSWNYQGEQRSNKLTDYLRLNNTVGSFVDGWITCSFTRPGRTVVEDRVFDLNSEKFYMLMAAGAEVENRNQVGFHDILYTPSSSPVDFTKVEAIQVQSDPIDYVKLHGAFMVAAWIGAASCGILIARYFKQTWTRTQICGKDAWFVWHRSLMVLVWSLTITAFVLIFVKYGVAPLQNAVGSKNPHAILGCVTTGLAFIQPIMAAFRPHPGTPKRPIFNWLHWLVGNLAHIFAIITIFLAVSLKNAQLPDLTYWIMIGYVGFHCLMHLVFSVHQCQTERSGVHVISPANKHSSHTKVDAPGSLFRKLMFAFFVIVILGLTTALVLLVVLAPIEGSLPSWFKS